jgi:hypothetical protein
MPSEPQQPLLSQFDKNVGLGGDVTVTVGARRSGIAICAGFDGNWIGSRYIRGAPLRAGAGAGADAADEDIAAGSATTGACALAKDPTSKRKKHAMTIQIRMARTSIYNHSKSVEVTGLKNRCFPPSVPAKD